MNQSKFVNACPVLISEDVAATVDYYVNMLGFRYAKHYDKKDNFCALYRDSIEIIVVQSKFGKVESNNRRYGAGYDIYIDPDSVQGVDMFYDEYVERGVNIVEKPHMTDYGSYEFVVQDVDGRWIGIGRIRDQEVFFQKSDYFNE